MATLQIDTNYKNIIQEIKDFVDTNVKTISVKEFYEIFIVKRMSSFN